jgi:hypothetical protein
MCAVCLVVLVAWLQDHRRDKARRRRWELKPDMPLEDELEIRRRVLGRRSRDPE